MPTVKDIGGSSIDQLDDAAQKQEQDFVIDFGSDRLIKWIGVYLFLGLALLVKIGEAVETNIQCYPGNFSDVNDHLIAFASAYCWETGDNLAMNNCSSFSTTNIPLLQNPSLLKEFLQWFPYILLIQAFAFALPWAYWHFRMGARLTGHLRFMRLLLSTIFDKLKEIEKVFYDEMPYDENCQNFDGSHLYESKLTLSKDAQPSSSSNVTKQSDQKSGTPSSQNDKSISVTMTTQNQSVSSSLLPPDTSSDPKVQVKIPKTSLPNQKLSLFQRVTVGSMTDRHFFSMLCFENFASMHHLPYILSVFQLTKSCRTPKEPEAAYYYLNQGLLNLWCNNKNMNNIIIVKRYMWKHLFTAFMSLLFLTLLVIFGVAAYKDAMSSETFLCQIHPGTCLLCTIRQMRDMFAVFMCNVLLDLLILFMSLKTWWNVRNSVSQIKCHYFDQLKETTNIAMTLAHEAED